MDPDACLRRFLEACEDRDRDEAVDALIDLHDWISRGGFLPTVMAVTYRSDHMAHEETAYVIG